MRPIIARMARSEESRICAQAWTMRRAAVARRELAHVALAHGQRGELRLQIAPQHVGLAHVLAHQRQHLLVEDAALDSFTGGMRRPSWNISVAVAP